MHVSFYPGYIIPFLLLPVQKPTSNAVTERGRVCVDRERILAGGKAFGQKVFLEDNGRKLCTNIALKDLDRSATKSYPEALHQETGGKNLGLLKYFFFFFSIGAEENCVAFRQRRILSGYLLFPNPGSRSEKLHILTCHLQRSAGCCVSLFFLKEPCGPGGKKKRGK